MGQLPTLRGPSKNSTLAWGSVDPSSMTARAELPEMEIDQEYPSHAPLHILSNTSVALQACVAGHSTGPAHSSNVLAPYAGFQVTSMGGIDVIL